MSANMMDPAFLYQLPHTGINPREASLTLIDTIGFSTHDFDFNEIKHSDQILNVIKSINLSTKPVYKF